MIPAANKYVLQYPPGTGFVLSLFPEGFQVIPLYVLANLVVASAFALLALVLRARSLPSLLLAAVFGACAIYLMINPTQGELFGGADHDGLRARGFSDREVVRRPTAASAAADRRWSGS